MVLATIFDYLHVVVFGPCAGPGALAIYGILLLTFSLGAILMVIGSGTWLVQKMRGSR